MPIDFESVLGRFTAAVEAGNGQALASLFTPNGIYDDRFYGAKVGRDAIAKMLEQEFWGHAEGFRWRMFEPRLRRLRSATPGIYSATSPSSLVLKDARSCSTGSVSSGSTRRAKTT